MTQQETEFAQRILDANSRLRNENHRLIIFLQALVDPEMYGHAVEPEVRRAAAALLGKQMVEV